MKTNWRLLVKDVLDDLTRDIGTVRSLGPYRSMPDQPLPEVGLQNLTEEESSVVVVKGPTPNAKEVRTQVWNKWKDLPVLHSKDLFVWASYDSTEDATLIGLATPHG